MADGFVLTSGAFRSGEPIPAEFTCEGDNVSPPLSWHNAPDGTRSIALVVDDPDAPAKTFVHWVLFNLPPDRTALQRGVDIDEEFAEAELKPVEGTNDFGETGYGGPCPPPRDSHRYFFRLYALDTIVDLATGASKKQLTNAMNGHVLAEADLCGTYKRGG